MYCPPESGNMEPSSANATQAHSEITPPSTHTRKNSVGLGKGPAISLAVRKIEEPMMPLTSSSTESSRLSPRTRLGFGAEGSGSVAGEAVSIVVGRLRCWSLVVSRLSFGSAPLDTARICERPTTSDQRQVLSHAQFVRRFQRRSAAAADDGQAIAAGKGIADLHRADWTVQHRRGFLGVRRCFRSDFHGLELCARNCHTIPGGARGFAHPRSPRCCRAALGWTAGGGCPYEVPHWGGLRRIRSPSIGGSEMGNCQTLSFIQRLITKSSRSFHGPIHLLLVANKTQPCASGLPGVSITI